MLASLLLALALAGQASVPTGLSWDFDDTHLGAAFDVETPSGVLPCTNAVLTPTVDSRCTVTLVREVEQVIRLRINKQGVTVYSSPLTLPPVGEGGAGPGAFRVTFAGELPGPTGTASRAFNRTNAAHIVSTVSGEQAGNNVGGQASWTYAVWLRIAAAGDGGTIYGTWAGDADHQAALLLNGDGSVIGWMRGDLYFNVRSAAGAITPGQWHLVVFRHRGNGFSGDLSLWIDDVAVAWVPTAGTAPITTAPFKIGAHGTTTLHVGAFHGQLSSVGVWRVVGLPDPTLQSLRARYPSAPPPGLSFLTIKDRDEVVDYIGGMPLVNAGTVFSSDGPRGGQP